MSEPKAHDPLDALTDLQFLFVTGKGGVGKSTCSGLLGLHAAERGRDALVVLPQTSHNTPSLFGRRLTHEPQLVHRSGAGSLSLVVIDPESAMREYCRQILRSRMLTDALFNPKVAGGFLTGIPGLGEWALLGKSWAWSRSGTFALPSGQTRYDLVVFDAPASGDGSKMLKVPQIIMDLSPRGRLREDAQACREMLSDASRSAVVLVTLAEDLSITETAENIQFIEAELGLPVGPLLVNRLSVPLIDDRERLQLIEALEGLGQPPSAHPTDLTRLIQAGITYGARQGAQERQLRRAASWGRPIVKIPEVTEHLGNVAALSRLLGVVTGARAPQGDRMG